MRISRFIRERRGGGLECRRRGRGMDYRRGWRMVRPYHPPLLIYRKRDRLIYCGVYVENCALVIRMTHDFDTDIGLPLASGGFMPTLRAMPFQKETWGELLLAANDLFDTCVEGRGMPGWASVTGNIVVAFWWRGSKMDGAYGAGVGVGSGNGTGVGIGVEVGMS